MAKVTAPTTMNIRKNFGKMPKGHETPHLLEMQRKSYDEFLQINTPPSKRKDTGLQSAFKSAFPIVGRSENITIEFVDYKLDPPMFSDALCKKRGKTYASSMHVKVRMMVYGKKASRKKSATRTPLEVKEQEVYFGMLPRMTERGTFVINGTERVVVSQLHRSPGAFFSHDKGKTHASGKLLYKARIIPHRGVWLDFEFDAYDKLYVRIDRRSKLPVTTLLHALGMDNEEILKSFFNNDEFKLPPPQKGSYRMNLYPGELTLERFAGRQFSFDLKRESKVLIKAGKSIGESEIKRLKSARLRWVDVPSEFLTDPAAPKTLADDVADADGELVAKKGEVLTADLLRKIETADVKALETISADGENEEFKLTPPEKAVYRMNLYPGDLTPERFKGLVFDFDFKQDNKVLIKAGARINPRDINLLKTTRLRWLDVPREFLADPEKPKVLAKDIVSSDGELLGRANEELTEELLSKLEEAGIKTLSTIFTGEEIGPGPYISTTLRDDKVPDLRGAQAEIYKVMRPGEPGQAPDWESVFVNLFQDATRYELSACGRMKFNRSMGRDSDEGPDTLDLKDITDVLKKLIDLRDGKGDADDIDHLGNRRVRSVGEATKNAMQTGLERIRRAVAERLNQPEIEKLSPRDLITPKPVTAALRDFFVGSQMSQFMDQVNPLSEVTHKRRISALGPGGLVRERAGFEVREVHPTHYGRICPVETPEGQNIGLISSLAIYARTDEHGFLETPYRKVSKGRVTDRIDHLSAIQEGEYVIAQASATLDAKGALIDEFVPCRKRGEVSLMPASEIDYMDVAPHQIVSVAASLIPFLEHDDANRALMGSNMQRQAVPTMVADRPLVGTGMERQVALNSGALVRAERAGVIKNVDARRIVVEDADPDSDETVKIYPLTKYLRSNQDTSINQRPLVKAGDWVNPGDVLADGPSTDAGELALGQNVLVALMPWEGYNFEDSILISERLVQDGCFTSVHIKELTCTVRDTKLGAEEITADIPNINESFLTKLDESGIIHIGAEVQAGDILVGKITPKSEGQPTPEEKLWRAIFREKATDVKDTSLRVSPGVEGTVIDVSIFTSSKGDSEEKSGREIEIEEQGIEKLKKDRDDMLRIYEDDLYERLEKLFVGKVADGGPNGLKKGTKVTAEYLHGMVRKQWNEVRMRTESVSRKKEQLIKQHKERTAEVKRRFEGQRTRLLEADDLQPGELKKVKVYIAVKRRIQPGDKLAGRHGNKGVISMIAPVEDMPYMSDGTPVDVVLNPLGVPSRMNIGQILEAHLGWAGHTLGRRIDAMLEAYKAKEKKAKDVRDLIEGIYKGDENEAAIKRTSDADMLRIAERLRKGVPMATPVFDGASEDEIKAMLKAAGLPTSGKTTLHDGRTGDAFDNEVTVGQMYILKLNHLVDDKMHARSTGPYSMVTQQPLGGKAKLGGQRFGEMEVWALEAYGASHTLQEFLTVKSDDIDGRSKVYKNIVNDDFNVEPNLPESFNVLVKEVRSLGINITCEQDED